MLIDTYGFVKGSSYRVTHDVKIVRKKPDVSIDLVANEVLIFEDNAPYDTEFLYFKRDSPPMIRLHYRDALAFLTTM